MFRFLLRLAMIAIASFLAYAAGARADTLSDQTRYFQTNLVMGNPGPMPMSTASFDRHLLNSWGMAFAPNGAFWISDNHAGMSTLYDGRGVKFGLEVAIPGAPATGLAGAPTGIAWNGSLDFKLPTNHAPAIFIFAGEDGTISAWNGGQSATLLIDNFNSGSPQSGAVYKGLALGSNPDGNFAFVTNFRSGFVEAYNSDNFSSGNPTPVFTFTDNDLPRDFVPFGIHNINGNLWVTFAKRNPATEDDVAGAGNGYVDVFDTRGNLLRRFAANGVLNSPWGVAQAPLGFGRFAGAILIGNFGEGRINAFDVEGNHLGHLLRRDGQPVTIKNLWSLHFGGGANSSPDALYFTAGPANEQNGLFGKLEAATPSSGS